MKSDQVLAPNSLHLPFIVHIYSKRMMRYGYRIRNSMPPLIAAL